MDQKTRRLLDELQGAINQALLGSNRFAEILNLLEESGRAVSVSVDATIEGIDDRGGPHAKPARQCVPGELSLSTDDRKFLQALKIVVEVED